MAVNDHGIEVLRKSGEEVTPGNKAEYCLKTKIINSSGEPIPVAVTTLPSGTATASTLLRAATSTLVLAVNLNRLGATIFNNSSGYCFIKFGATATTAAFTFRMSGLSLYVMDEPIYTGTISAIWASAGTGNLQITEFTP